MRRAIAGTVIVVVVMFLWKGLPFLRAPRNEVASTPTMQPFHAQSPIAVPKHGEACVGNVEFGPDARYLFVQAGSETKPTPPLTFVARAPGYTATAQHPGGLPDQSIIVQPIRPAKTETVGQLCVRNEGRRPVSFAGVPPSVDSTVSQTTLNGTLIDQDLALALLKNPSVQTVDLLGPMFSHAAAFRPVTGWELWILAILAALGVPAAIAYALGRAAREDDARDKDE